MLDLALDVDGTESTSSCSFKDGNSFAGEESDLSAVFAFYEWLTAVLAKKVQALPWSGVQVGNLTLLIMKCKLLCEKA